MLYKDIKNAGGFNLTEIIVSLAVITMMAGVSVASFSNFLKRENLSASSSALANALRDARSRTLASVKGMQYGVKIDADRFTLFSGATFASSTAENPYIFANGVRATTAIPVVLFTRVTGNSNASGTIDLYLSGNPTVKKSVGIQNTGLVNLF